jgi:GNAT superfamily N-acetyltransferase
VSRVAALVAIRSYEDADEAAVLDLLNAVLGGGPAGSRPEGFFRWKHREGPFGPSFMLVAEADGRIVGLRAFMRWEFVAGSRRFRAVRAVDTATHPDHQGRGIFSKLTLEALERLRGEADFVFNTPNEKSLPGYLKMGWQVVGRVPIRVQVRRPIRFAARARSWRTTAAVEELPPTRAPAAAEVLDDRIDALLAEPEPPTGIATPRDARYLRWRFGRAPLLDYRAVTVGERGRVEGLAVFRARARGSLAEATVAEAIVRRGDRRTAGRLLRSLGRAAHLDHVACSFPPDSSPEHAARRAAFLRVPGGMTLVVNTLGHDLSPDPRDLRAWSLSLGDLEVF